MAGFAFALRGKSLTTVVVTPCTGTLARTHLNCTVQYAGDSHRIWCACHNGFFDLNGRVVEGPPPDPLEEYAVNIRGEDVMVSRKG